MTTEQILTDLMSISSQTAKSVAEIVIDNQNGDAPTDFKFVPLVALTDLINDVRAREQEEKDREQYTKPVKKFLFVEDGSVDCDKLTEDLSIKNPEIKVVVYRQGAREPQLKDISE